MEAGCACPVCRPQPVYNGLDQIDIALPLGLRGFSEVDVVFKKTARRQILGGLTSSDVA
jgi:hypothetical protein